MADLKLKDLRYLVAVADTRHFGQAAARCFVSQPTLSAQLKKLEDYLGVQLVERHPRRIALTEAGTQVVARARRIIEASDEIVSLTALQRDPLAGRLRVALLPTIGPYLLPLVAARIRKKLPRVELLLYEYQTGPMLDHLQAGDIDMGILALPVPADGLVERTLFDEPFVVAVPENHVLGTRKSLKTSDLDGETLLLLEDGHCLRDQALDVCSHSKVQEKQDFRATSLETLRQMVASGGGITLLPQLASSGAYGHARGVAIVPFARPVPVRHVGALWRKTSAKQEAIKAVCDVIAEAAIKQVSPLKFAADISVYDRMVWPPEQVGEWLAIGYRRRELRAYLGDAEYDYLQPMAVAAAQARRDPDRCVFVVPGIMGSQLGLTREAPPDNLLWLDPTDFQRGDLMQLAWSPLPVRSLGPMLYTFLPLKFALETAGYTVRCFDYDWRRDIAELGLELSRRVAIEPARHVSVIGHSLGGLVARAALRTDAGSRIERLITLGTPHGGSYAPVQALRGTYPLIRRLAQLDLLHSAEALARDVFATFHSLYQMLPHGEATRSDHLNLLDSRNWPRHGPQPNATLLDRVPFLDLGGADSRIGSIAGYGYDTPVNIALVGDDFYYRYGAAGDGTVPTARAALAGTEAWYCRVAHNELPRSSQVHAAVVAVLGEARPQLPGAPPALADQPRSVSDEELRALFNSKIDWSRLDVASRRRFLDSLNESPAPA